MPLTEAHVQSRLDRALNKRRPHGPYVLKTSQPGPKSYGTYGIPDRILCYRGRFVALELKAENVKPEASPRQQLELDKIEEAGGIAYCVNSVEAALAVLDEIDEEMDA